MLLITNTKIKGLLTNGQKEGDSPRNKAITEHHFAVMDMWRCEHALRGHRLGRTKMMREPLG